MPRANRIYFPGAVWHITHRCHDGKFLLKFERDRLRWKHWLFQARKRFGLSVLTYIATSNHIHLLVKDSGREEIRRSMQLIAGRTAQEYNQRKSRKGAFWEGRYFATAVNTDMHLIRCLVYIDLNMVRTGVVAHPGQWRVSGFNEIQLPPRRYRIIDAQTLCDLTCLPRFQDFQAVHRSWVEDCMGAGRLEREPLWTESVAVGSESYIDRVKSMLGVKVYHRSVEKAGDESDQTFMVKDSW